MRDDFCAFILTHGRPDSISTYRTLRTHGYTGKIFLVIDDEDDTGEEYKSRFGDDVLVFSKDEIEKYTDRFDNTTDRRAILWARNVCWALARQQGYKYFIQLDDDYYYWGYRRMGKGHKFSISNMEEYHSWKVDSLDMIFAAMTPLIETTPIKTIALAQGGDHVGGTPRRHRFKRKAMNSFICSTDRPFLFRGRFNDDVNTYVSLGSVGDLFFTDMEVYLSQADTQTGSGGMAEVSQESGTYVKSFYTILTAPSCTTINSMGNIRRRLHHCINWNKAVPKILRQ